MQQLQFISGQMNKLSTFIHLLSIALSLLLACNKTVVGYTFCSEKQDGLYPSAYNCKHYYECQNSITIIRNCTEGQFDHNELQCKANAECLNPPFPHCNVDCTTHENGDMFPNPEECATYFECSWNTLLIRPCSPGLYFNPDLPEPNCDRPENVICATCTSNSTSTTGQPGTSTSELPENTSVLPGSTFPTSESTPTTDPGYETTTPGVSTTASELSSTVTPPVTTTFTPQQEDNDDNLLVIILPVAVIILPVIAIIIGTNLFKAPEPISVSGLSLKTLPPSPHTSFGVISGQQLLGTPKEVGMPPIENPQSDVTIDINNNPTIVETAPSPKQHDSERRTQQLQDVCIRRAVDATYKSWIQVNLIWFSKSTSNIEQVRIFAHEIISREDDIKMREEPNVEKQCAIFYKIVKDAGFIKIHVVINALREAGQKLQADELQLFFDYHCPSNPDAYNSTNIIGPNQENLDSEVERIVATYNIHNHYTINNFYNYAGRNSAIRHSA